MALPTQLTLDIVTPYGPILTAQTEEVTATGAVGEFGILPGHLPLLSALRPGPMTFKRQGERHQLQLGAGFAEAGADHVVLLVDTCERGEIYALKSLLEWQPHLEVEPLKNALARADNRLRDLEAEGQAKGEEYTTLDKLVKDARGRLEKR